MAFGVKIKIGVDMSQASELQKDIQKLVEAASEGIAVQIKKLSVESKAGENLLEDIQSVVNNGALTIKNVQIDGDEKVASKLRESVQKSLDAAKLDIKIDNIDAANAVNKLRTQLTEMLSGLSITGVKDFVGAKGIDGMFSGAAANAEKLAAAQKKISENAAALKAATQEVSQMQNELNSLYTTVKKLGDDSFKKSFVNEYRDLLRIIHEIKDKSGDSLTQELNTSHELIDSLREEVNQRVQAAEAAKKAAEATAQSTNKQREDMKALNTLQKSLESVHASMAKKLDNAGGDELLAEYNNIRNAIMQAKNAESAASDQELANITRSVAALREKVSAQQQVQKAAAKSAAEQEKANSVAANGATRSGALMDRLLSFIGDNTIAARQNAEAISEMFLTLAKGANITEAEIKSVTSALSAMKSAANISGTSGKNPIDRLQDGLSSGWDKFGAFSIGTNIMMDLANGARKAITAVKELDSALTELRKVTDLTESEYDQFMDRAAVSAREVGASVVDTVNATADFARLGYSVSEAEELADAALIYKNVGDGVSDISESTQSLISTMKAFDVEAQNSMSIVDAFNKVGNEFAISSSGIGEALQRSAAALAAGGNTLEESIGLVVGMNNVIQDPQKVGTTLKTVSMYLRAAKTDLEAAGESTEGMANSVSELRQELMEITSYTNAPLDIMLDDTTFKSTYQVMEELAAIWDDLADIDQANILKLIGGKRNSNAVVSLLTNWEDAAAAMEAAMNSAGSATEENEKFLDSIQGKLNELQAAFETMARKLIDSDLVKFVVDLGTKAMDFLSWLIDHCGALTTAIAGVSTVMGLMGKNTFSTFKTVYSSIDGAKGRIDQFLQAIRQYFTFDTSEMINIDQLKEFGRAIANNEIKALGFEGALNSVSGEFGTFNTATKNAAKAVFDGAGSVEDFGKVAQATTARVTTLKAVMNGLKTAGIALAIGLVVQGITNFINTRRELAEMVEKNRLETFDNTVDTTESLGDLYDKFNELYAGVQNTGAMSDEFIEITYDLIDALGLEGKTIDDLAKSYGGLDSVLRDAYINKLEENLRLMLSTLSSKTDEVMDDIGGEPYTIKVGWTGLNEVQPGADEWFNTQRAGGKTYAEIEEQAREIYLERWGDFIIPRSVNELEQVFAERDALVTLYNGGFVSREKFDRYMYGNSSDYGDFTLIDSELKQAIEDENIYGIIEGVERLKAMQSALFEAGQTQNAFYEQITSSIALLDSVYELEADAYDPARETLFNIAKNEIDKSRGDILPKTRDEFIKYKQDIVDAMIAATPDYEALFGDDEDSARKAVEQYVDTWADQTGLSKQFAESMNSQGIIVENSLINYEAQIESVESIANKMQEAQELLRTAQSEMAAGGLSADTVSAISEMLDDDESLFDYLTIENGQIELNMQKWQERAQTIANTPSVELDKEITGLQQEIDWLTNSEEDGLRHWQNELDNATTEEGRANAQAHIDSINKSISVREDEIAQLEREKALYEELFDSSAFAYDAMFSGLESVKSEASDVVSALESLNEGTALTQAEMFELAKQHPELLSMEGFLEADTVEEQQALLQELLSAYESAYGGIIEMRIEALQADKRQALYVDEDYERAQDLQNQINALKEMQKAGISVDTEEVDTWDQLTEAVSNTTEAYELLDEVKQQIGDTGSPELDTLMSFRDLVGDEAFAGMFKVDENTGEQVFDVGAAEKWLSDSNAVKTRMQELDTEMWTLLADADANSEAIAENRRQWGLLDNELERIKSSHISNIFADTLESGIDYADKIADIAEQAQEEFAKFGTVGADTILDLSELTGLDVGGLVDEGYLEQVGDGYKFVTDGIQSKVEAELRDIGVSEELIDIIMQTTFELGEEANAYEQLISAMEQVSSNADLLSDVNLDMADDGRLSMETLVDLLQWLNENGISDEGIINWGDGYATANIDALNTVMEEMIDNWVDAGTVSEEQAAIMREEQAAALELSEGYDQLSDSISDVTSRTDLLAQARSDMTSGKGLSDDTITSVIGSLGEGELLSDYIVEENGVLALNERAWIQKSIAQRQAAIAELQNKQLTAETSAEQQEAALQIRLHTLAIRDLIDAYNDLGVDAAYDKFNAAQDAMSSYGGGAEITYDNIRELIDVDSRYAAAIDRENGVLVLNAEKHAEITEAILEETKATAEAAKQAVITGDEYQTLWEKYNAGTLSLDEAKRLRDLEAQIAGYDALTASIDDTTDAYHRWLNRPSDTADRSDAMTEAAEYIKEALTDKESEDYYHIGTENFQAAWNLVVGADVEINYDNFDDAMETVQAYVANGLESGKNFYKALVENGIADAETGELIITDIEEAASRLNMSVELYRAAVDNYNNVSDPDKQITVATPEIEDNQEQLSALDQLIKDLEDANTKITSLKENPLEVTWAEGTEETLSTFTQEASQLGDAFSRVGSASEAISRMVDVISGSPLSINTSEIEDGVRHVEEQIGRIRQAVEEINKLSMTVDTAGGVQNLATLQSSAGTVRAALMLVSTELTTIANRVLTASAKPLSISTGNTPSALGSVSSQLSTIISRLSQIRNMSPINVSINETTTRTTINRTVNRASAGGIANAKGTAMATGGRTLVGELGRETVVDPHKNIWYTVGDNGAEFVELPPDAIVFNHEQTERLMSIGKIPERGEATGKAFASGKAAASIINTIVNMASNAAKTIGNAISTGVKTVASGIKKSTTKKSGATEAISQAEKDYREGVRPGYTKGEGKDLQQGNVSEPGKGSGGSSSSGKGSSSSSKGSSSGSKKGSSSSSSSSKSKYEDLLKKYQELNEQTEHLIEHQEFLYYQSERGLDYDGMADSLTEQARLYGEIMKDSQAAVDEMKAKGATDTDEELQEMERAYWDAYKSMYEKLDELNKLYVEALNEKIDGVQSAYDRFKGAAEEFSQYGGISMDTFQELLDGGLEYLSYLENINGQYVINEDAINNMIAAEKEQLSVESALSYLSQVREALGNDEADRLDHLANVSEQIGDSTWDMVYAQLEELKALGLSGDQYTQILNNIEAMRAVSDQVITDITGGAEELEEVRESQKSSFEDIIGLVEDLIEYETDQQIEAIEEQIDAYQEIIDLKKEALKASRDENDYEKDVAEQLKEIAELQSRIGQLSLDDSREGQAERAKLEEELAEAQEKLADLQGDNAYDKQVDALDKLGESFEEDKQADIDALEEKISSAEKLYQLAIDRIENGWSTLYEELIDWNTEAGSILNAEITQKWKEATAAAQEYGSYLEALRALGADPGYIQPEETNKHPTVVATGSAATSLGSPESENGTVTITGNDGSQTTYRFVDSMTDEQLSQLVGNMIDVRMSQSGMAAGETPTAQVQDNSTFTFAPTIQVSISHNGTMSDADVKKYGTEMANATLEQLRVALERKGVSTTTGAALKQ